MEEHTEELETVDNEDKEVTNEKNEENLGNVGEQTDTVDRDEEKLEEGDEKPVEDVTQDSNVEQVGGEEDIKIQEEEAEHIGEEVEGEQLEGEHLEGEQDEVENKEETKPPDEEKVEEEEKYVEEPPPDPTAPYDLSDSKEALKEPFELRPDQVAEIEQLWELYQNYTPAYTDINGYITEKELVYMLKSLLLMTHTPEQLQELIAYCVRPADTEGHINYEQFLKMVKLRQRDFPTEDELRSALQVFDPGRTGTMERDYFKEVLAKQGLRMPQKQLDNLIKEVDMSNDGTIGIEDVVGTMCIDLNKEDMMMLRAAVFPPDEPPPTEEM